MTERFIDADPYPFLLDPDRAALIVIDMQRDLIERGGFGASLLIEDATASYFPEFKAAAIAMMTAQGGIIGWSAKTDALLATLA